MKFDKFEVMAISINDRYKFQRCNTKQSKTLKGVKPTNIDNNEW